MKWADHPLVTEAFRQCVAAGMTAQQTANHLNKQFRYEKFTRNMCIGRARRLGLRFVGGHATRRKKVTL